jgi:hypothetical protein
MPFLLSVLSIYTPTIFWRWLSHAAPAKQWIPQTIPIIIHYLPSCIETTMAPESWASFHSRHQSTQTSSRSLLSSPPVRRRRSGILGCLANLVNPSSAQRRHSSPSRRSIDSPMIYSFHDEVKSDLGYNFNSPQTARASMRAMYNLE